MEVVVLTAGFVFKEARWVTIARTWPSVLLVE